MVTRVFWIAVSLLESDYEHEFLMAIHLLNKVSDSEETEVGTYLKAQQIAIFDRLQDYRFPLKNCMVFQTVNPLTPVKNQN